MILVVHDLDSEIITYFGNNSIKVLVLMEEGGIFLSSIFCQLFIKIIINYYSSEKPHATSQAW